MCHPRGDWSRTGSKAAETERDRELPGARAKRRIEETLNGLFGDDGADDGENDREPPTGVGDDCEREEPPIPTT